MPWWHAYEICIPAWLGSPPFRRTHPPLPRTYRRPPHHRHRRPARTRRSIAATAPSPPALRPCRNSWNGRFMIEHVLIDAGHEVDTTGTMRGGGSKRGLGRPLPAVRFTLPVGTDERYEIILKPLRPVENCRRRGSRLERLIVSRPAPMFCSAEWTGQEERHEGRIERVEPDVPRYDDGKGDAAAGRSAA